MKSLLDPQFRYIPSHETDIRKRFEEERRKLEQQHDMEVGQQGIIVPGTSLVLKNRRNT